jgi:hypothetical protein
MEQFPAWACLVLTTCQDAEPPPRSPRRVEPVPAARTEAPASPRPPADEALRAVGMLESERCERTRCCVTSVARLGRDQRGREIAVISLKRGDSCLLGDREWPFAPEGEEHDEREFSCDEYWLADLSSPGDLHAEQLPGQCTGDKWDAFAAVDEEKKTFTTGGRSVFTNVRTNSELTLGLDPLRPIERHTSSYSPESLRSERWSWQDFRGGLTLGLDYCKGKRPRDLPVAESDSPPIEIRAVKLPTATLPLSFLHGAWRTTSLGRCAARIGGEHGFTLRGHGDAADASMSVLLSSTGELFLEISDDRFTRARSGFAGGDHVELWLAKATESCADLSRDSGVEQWGIRAVDGRVFLGAGRSAAAPTVEVASAAGIVRLKISFSKNALFAARLTVVYGDSDDGLRIERVFATSELVPKKWWTLGEGGQVGDEISCAIGASELEPRVVFSREF